MKMKAAMEAWSGRPLVDRRGSMCKGSEVGRKLEGQGPAKIAIIVIFIILFSCSAINIVMPPRFVSRL